MEYMFMQKMLPTDATGVEVSIDAIDPNNNFVHLGNATGDTTGMFGFTWTPPDIPGYYKIIATFDGSDSYWPSSATTGMYVQSAPQATALATAAPLSVADTYFVPASIGLFIMMIVVLIAILLLMRNKRP
jgi:hypothetical protein